MISELASMDIYINFHYLKIGRHKRRSSIPGWVITLGVRIQVGYVRFHMFLQARYLASMDIWINFHHLYVQPSTPTRSGLCRHNLRSSIPGWVVQIAAVFASGSTPFLASSRWKYIYIYTFTIIVHKHPDAQPSSMSSESVSVGNTLGRSSIPGWVIQVAVVFVGNTVARGSIPGWVIQASWCSAYLCVFGARFDGYIY